MLKKVICLLAITLLTGCGSKYEAVEIEYLNANRESVVKDVLGDKVSDTDETSIEMYYNELDDGAYDIQIWNATDYYYSGSVNLPECEKSISLTALPPQSGYITTLVCPAFDAEANFEYEGSLYERKEEKQLKYTYESYYYEEYPNVYDYVLDVSELDDATIKEFTNYLYEELVLKDVKEPITVYLFTQASYELDLYEEACKGILWIDQVNDFAEISDIDGNLIERLNYRD